MREVRRKLRRAKLERHGLLLFEAEDLAGIPFKVPYFRAMVRDRFKALVRWRDRGKTMKAWQLHIFQLYERKGWMKVSKYGTRGADPFKMLRAYEDDYRQRFPTYVSPYEKRGRDMRVLALRLKWAMEKQT